MADNKWTRAEAPPPPLFTGKKEKDLVKQINDELIERVIGQTIIYYPISREASDYHPIYGEAINKTFLSPIKINALIEWTGTATKTGPFGADRSTSLKVHFHHRRLTEDQNVFVREGDFIGYDDQYYEIVSVVIPKLLYGDPYSPFEILANCNKARNNVFNGK